MKFLFYPQACLPFHGKTLQERPIGGTETGAICLSHELALLGHTVYVATQVPNPPLTAATYVPFPALGDIGPVDVLVSIREWMPLFLPIEAKLRLFWTGDAYDQPHNMGLGDKRVIQRVDAFLAVSNWHADTICQTSKYPRNRAWVIRNGVRTELFAGEEQRARKRLIYSSTPYRGLKHAPRLFQRVLEKHPDASFDVFSGYQVYSGTQQYSAPAEREFQQLKTVLESLPNCRVHGNVSQQQLAREYMRSAVLFYPNTFEETSCITSLEAQAAGCTTVTSKRAALPETVGESGILIPGEPGTAQYDDAFVHATNSILASDELFAKLSLAGRLRAKDYTWKHVAERLLERL